MRWKICLIRLIELTLCHIEEIAYMLRALIRYYNTYIVALCRKTKRLFLFNPNPKIIPISYELFGTWNCWNWLKWFKSRSHSQKLKTRSLYCFRLRFPINSDYFLMRGCTNWSSMEGEKDEINVYLYSRHILETFWNWKFKVKAFISYIQSRRVGELILLKGLQ